MSISLPLSNRRGFFATLAAMFAGVGAAKAKACAIPQYLKPESVMGTIPGELGVSQVAAFAKRIKPVFMTAVRPESAEEGDLLYETSTGRLLRRAGGEWTNPITAGNLTVSRDFGAEG